ncbi:uncharacterized protein METZ01_LOCUS291452, partial [marine metagenome]
MGAIPISFSGSPAAAPWPQFNVAGICQGVSGGGSYQKRP